MSYKFLEHATDAFIEVTATTLEEAFLKAGESVVQTTIDLDTVEEKDKKEVKVKGKELRHLLFNWTEEVIFQLITEGFAIHRFQISIKKEEEYELTAQVFGEPIDLQKHHFKVEIKAPTFHEMEIKEEKGLVKMRFLLDL